MVLFLPVLQALGTSEWSLFGISRQSRKVNSPKSISTMLHTTREISRLPEREWGAGAGMSGSSQSLQKRLALPRV